MKRYGKYVVLIAVVCIAIACAEVQAAPDQTRFVTATGTVQGSTSLSVLPASIAYGTKSVDSYATTPTITVTYTSNYNPWKIAIWTNNLTVPGWDYVDTSVSRYAKGGLVSPAVDHDNNAGTSAVSLNVVPCKWAAKKSSAGGITPPNPATAGSMDKYNFVVDKRDENDPLTTWKEAWADSFADGYADIAFGDQTGAGYVVDPNVKPLPANTQVVINGSLEVFIAGMFGTMGGIVGTPNPPKNAPAGPCSTTFGFDLYHE